MSGYSGDGRADRRRHDCGGAQAAQHDRGEAGDQGRPHSGRWKDKPAKLAQKDRDARWTVKYTKAKPRADGMPQVDLAIPAFGYKNHVSIDRGHGLIRNWTATDAAAHDGARLTDVLDRTNTASEVWADTAYRSAKNEAIWRRHGFVSRIHRKKPKGRPMAERTRIANAPQIQSPHRRRARVRASERADGPGCAHDRHRPGAGEDRTRQSRLQHAPVRLARPTPCPRCGRLSAEVDKPKNPPPRKSHPNQQCRRRLTGRSPTIPSISRPRPHAR